MKKKEKNIVKIMPHNKSYISDIILNNLVDLKDNYIKEYGPTDSWTDIQKNIFLLNADVMIEKTAEEFKIPISSKAKLIGLSKGICQVQLTLIRKYTGKRSVSDVHELEVHDRTNLNEDLSNSIYSFLVRGSSEYLT